MSALRIVHPDTELNDVLPDAAPRTIAAAFLASRPNIRHFRGDFYLPGRGVYRRAEPELFRSDLATFCDRLTYLEKGERRSFVPTSRRVNDVLDAVSCMAQVRCDQMPAWLDGRESPLPRNVIAFPNGLLDVAEYVVGKVRLLPPSAQWFSTTVLPFDFTTEPPPARRWSDFLLSVWPDDDEAIALLQEWAGYLLSGDTRFHKIALLVGPPRSGKGTLARIITAMLGADNVASPTLAGLAMPFGLSPLIGKTLAIVGDARLSSRSDAAIVVERLLSISGEDNLTIERKFKESVTLRLPTRLMLLSNELPRLTDASAAIAERFLILPFQRSFLGNEDHGLTEALLAELPGILAWALEGLKRLHARGRFVPAASGVEALDELRDISSPVTAFIRERCIVDANRSVSAVTLYQVWCEWCREQGREHSGSLQMFGRDLRSAIPTLKVSRPRSEDGRNRFYMGIGRNDAL